MFLLAPCAQLQTTSSCSQVPDYLDVVSQPMDFASMRKRIDAHGYRTMDEFEDDFNLVVKNCLTYNSKDTSFYRAAVKMRDQASFLDVRNKCVKEAL